MKGRIFKLGGIAAATIIGFSALVGMVQAQGDVIKERQELMKAQGAAMKAINGILEANGPAADIAPHAAKLQETSTRIVALFPAGSDKGDTKALPEIWSNPDDFSAKANALHDQSAMLVTAVSGGDLAAIGAQYKEVGAACGACHKPYKAK